MRQQVMQVVSQSSSYQQQTQLPVPLAHPTADSPPDLWRMRYDVDLWTNEIDRLAAIARQHHRTVSELVAKAIRHVWLTEGSEPKPEDVNHS